MTWSSLAVDAWLLLDFGFDEAPTMALRMSAITARAVRIAAIQIEAPVRPMAVAMPPPATALI